MFAGGERLRRRDLRGGIDDRVGLLNRQPWTLAIAGTHFDGALQSRSGKHRRPDADRAERPPGSGGDEVRRDAGIDRETRSPAASAFVTTAAFVEDDGTIDHDGVANNDVTLPRRQDHDGEARRHKIARLHEGPIGRILAILDNDLFGRERRPADIFRTPAPIDPGRRPFVAGNPGPAEAAIENPAAIVVGDPAPIVLIGIGGPVPAPFVGIKPMAVGIRAPIARLAERHPDLAPARMRLPETIGLERRAKIDGDLFLRLRRLGCQPSGRHRGQRDDKGSNGHVCQ
jgi:hypothetical protein